MQNIRTESRTIILYIELQMVQDLLSQADDILKQIRMEARGVDDDDMKNALLEKVSRVVVTISLQESIVRIIYDLPILNRNDIWY